MSNGTKSRLREAGIRPSAQRLAIAEVVLQGEHHFTADEVHDAARRRVPAVSLATVYNSLHLFVERGLLREVRLDGER
ncbi:MAG: Fur family transcriptional regulator, partial [Planctomycetota bacterium]